MGEFNWPTALGQLAILLATLSGFAYNIYRENRNRTWDLEDRKRARRELETKVETARALAMESQQQVLDKINENTIVSEKAFHEANDINQKILRLQQQLTSPFDRRAANIHQRETDIIEKTQKTVDETKKTVEETHEIAKEIERKL